MLPTPRSSSRAVAGAALAYVTTCLVGAGVLAGVVDTSRARWVHHALFVATASATGLAVGLLAASGRPAHALVLAPAAVPLAALARVSTRTDRHALVALSTG